MCCHKLLETLLCCYKLPEKLLYSTSIYSVFRPYRVFSYSRMQAKWKEYRANRRHAQLVCVDTEVGFIERSKSHLTNALYPRKWWSILKMAVFGASSSLPTVVDRHHCFLAHLDAKQCRDSYQEPHSCDLTLVLCSVAFRPSFT